MPASRTAGRPKVLYIASAFRSGSTILDAVLGELESFYSVGELRSLWENGIANRYLCACGCPVEECGFWRRVLEAASVPESPPSADRVIALQQRHLRTRPRQLAALWREAHGTGGASPARSYTTMITRLYSALSAETGAAVIVDSSKVPAVAYALATLAPIDLYVVHLVRDPRAVVHSWSRDKELRREPHVEERSGRDLMAQWPPWRACAQWLSWNATAERMVRPELGGRYLRLRYEDFVRAPRDALASITALVEEDRSPGRPFVRADAVRLNPGHGLPGNPTSFSGREVVIRPDDEWFEAMPGATKLAVTLTTLPLLRHYGYAVRWDRSLAAAAYTSHSASAQLARE